MSKWKMGLGAAAVAALLLVGVVASQDRSLAVEPAPASAMPSATPPPGTAFSVFYTGRSAGTVEGLIVAGGSWFKARHPSQIAVLVKHPKGDFLFDSGLGRQVDQQVRAMSAVDRQFFAYTDVHPVADQMEAHGWRPQEVRLIIPSHMHWDHASGLPDFPQAAVWSRTAEREGAEHGKPPAFIRSQFEGVRQWRELALTGPAYMGFPHSLDVYGDGAVVLVPMEGHTAGQVGMFLSLPSGRRYFFTGDATWTLEGFTRPADRSWVVRSLLHLDHDEAANQAVIRHVHGLMQAHPELMVVPAHDENVLKRLPHFPQFQG